MFERFVEIGRVVYVADGKDADRLAVIVNVVDANRVLITGPCTGVPRQVIQHKKCKLTKFNIPKVLVNMRSVKVEKLWKATAVDKEWAASSWAKKIAAHQRRDKMNDFDRFKLFKAKQTRNRMITKEMAKLKKKPAKQTATKATKPKK